MAKVRYAAWRLTVEAESEAASVPEAEALESISHSEGEGTASMESIQGTDERKKVDREHFMPGGKYRAIVKLLMKYEKTQPGRWSMGTGWLIAPDIVVTAGHCSFNKSRQLGRVVKVRAYIGYAGRESLKDMEGNQVQLRLVESVLTTSEWVEKTGQRERDVALFKLQTPFDLRGGQPYKFQATPDKGDEILGIVGYPGDLFDDVTGEKGAHMMESFERVQYDLTEGPRQMLYYNIDTYGGNSGSAVLRQSDMITSIGVHCYGGSKNHASAIGKYGNSLTDMKHALDVFTGTIGNEGVSVSASISPEASFWLNFVEMQTTEPFVALKIRSNGSNGESGDGESISSGRVHPELVKTFKTALHQGRSRDFDKTPLGPIGPHLGALAAVALNAAGNFGRPGAEIESAESAMEAGVTERAILGEAAIASIVKLGPRKATEEGLFDIMAEVVKKIGPVVNRVAPKVLGAMKDSALNIAIKELNGLKTPLPPPAEAEDFRIQVEPKFNKRAEFTDLKTEAFTEGLLGASRAESEEFLGFLGPLVKVGLGLAKGVLENADEGLQAIAESSEGIEAGDMDPFVRSPSSFSGLGARAVLGEAALEALIQYGPEKMQEKIQDESLFDVFKRTVKVVGGTVLKHAPAVINNVLPIVSSLATGEAGSDFFDRGKNGAEAESDFLSKLGGEAGDGESIDGGINGFPKQMKLFTRPLKVKYVTRDKIGMRIGEASWELEVGELTIPEGLVTLEIFNSSGSSHINFPVEELRISIGKAQAPDWTPPETYEFTDDSVVGGVLNWDQKAVYNQRMYIEVVGHPTHPPLSRSNIETYVVPDLQASLTVTVPQVSH